MSSNVHVQTSKLTFSIGSCQEIGKDGNKNIYDIDVVFDSGIEKKSAGFIVRAGSLKVALEIIETLGQQTFHMKKAEFKTFKGKHATTVFRVAHSTEEGSIFNGGQKDTLILYRNNRSHDGLKRVFAKPAASPIGPVVSLNEPTLRQIDDLAREWADYDPTDKQEERLRVEFRKK